MTPNEKLVWAAAFADSLVRHGMPEVAAFDAWRSVQALRGIWVEKLTGEVRELFEEMRRDA